MPHGCRRKGDEDEAKRRSNREPEGTDLRRKAAEEHDEDAKDGGNDRNPVERADPDRNENRRIRDRIAGAGRGRQRSLETGSLSAAFNTSRPRRISSMVPIEMRAQVVNGGNARPISTPSFLQASITGWTWRRTSTITKFVCDGATV